MACWYSSSSLSRSIRFVSKIRACLCLKKWTSSPTMSFACSLMVIIHRGRTNRQKIHRASDWMKLVKVIPVPGARLNTPEAKIKKIVETVEQCMIRSLPMSHVTYTAQIANAIKTLSSILGSTPISISRLARAPKVLRWSTTQPTRGGACYNRTSCGSNRLIDNSPESYILGGIQISMI